MIELREHLNNIVEPNVSAFLSEPGSVRLGFNAAWSIDSLASHLFEALTAENRTEFKTDSKFKEDLARRDRDFHIVWDVSTASKHAKTSRKYRLIKSSAEIKMLRVEGWLAFFAGIEDHVDWGDKLLIANEDFGLVMLDRSIDRAFDRLRAECAPIL